MRRTIFLDRDGVITEDPPHYAHRIDQLKLIPRTGEAIRMLNEMDYLVIVVSNQSGVARGYYHETDIECFNDEMIRQLAHNRAHIDAIYYCPHHPEAKIAEYRVACWCRKPKPGMLQQAAEEHHINLNESYIIGDKRSDIEAGRRAGCRGILVLTGHGADESSKVKDGECFIAKDLYDAVNRYIREE
ncbi:MAG: D-glycero-beta-D-manno-heptose 1,7-bisphosphate 7-phosphatase [Candidatus Thermoplasmatota archaeon]|nr:D-glycero-beta-D-manno-heptose 1,7-bisphosphate 7-phosphatase [Candidatus Thermoplasmatota archaeon]